MSTILQPMPKEIESVLIGGDLARLSVDQRLSFYNSTCESLGLNPLTKPFQYLTLNGKMILYATKDCTEQLRNNRKVSLHIVSREVVEGVYVVTARAAMPDGREDESVGAVPLPASPTERANAIMKAETKAKRRVTLSICGLGMLDESELETVTGSKEAQQEVLKRKLSEVKPKEIESPIAECPHGGILGDPCLGCDNDRLHNRQAEAEGIIEGTKANPKPKRNKGDISFKALAEFGELKKALREVTGTDQIYYDTLKAGGVAHADELAHEPSKAVWKAMVTILAKLRADKATREEFQAEASRLAGKFGFEGPKRFSEHLAAMGFDSLDSVIEEATAEQVTVLLTALRTL